MNRVAVIVATALVASAAFAKPTMRQVADAPVVKPAASIAPSALPVPVLPSLPGLPVKPAMPAPVKLLATLTIGSGDSAEHYQAQSLFFAVPTLSEANLVISNLTTTPYVATNIRSVKGGEVIDQELIENVTAGIQLEIQGKIGENSQPVFTARVKQNTVTSMSKISIGNRDIIAPQTSVRVRETTFYPPKAGKTLDLELLPASIDGEHRAVKLVVTTTKP